MTISNYSPKFVPQLDPDFKPASLENKAFLEAVDKSGKAVPLTFALERSDGNISTYKTRVFSEDTAKSEKNKLYVERLIKTVLWLHGGFRILIAGPENTCKYIKEAYSEEGIRAFDAKFMSRVYEKPFTVDIVDITEIPETKEKDEQISRNLKGCRIGFDAGGSDRKVSAVIDGNTVYSEEVIWHPKTQSNPDYHYNEILTAMKTAASHMPRVDAIGVSSAGIYVNNRTMVASLFLQVPQDLFDEKVKDIYPNIQKEMGNVPLKVANDGDVTALAGAMSLNDTNILGIAMGTSEAAGYINGNGNITGWLNELAFVPVDYNSEAILDEWSGDYGCGVKYFSQDSVIKLAPKAGIQLDEGLTPAEKLKVVQEFLNSGDDRAIKIFESIGCYLGYAIAHYADFYDIRHILILGRVTSGNAGNIIINKANEVMEGEFPELYKKIALHLPDESNRRVGQSIAAASLP